MDSRNVVVSLLNRLQKSALYKQLTLVYLFDFGFLYFRLFVGFGGLSTEHFGSHLRLMVCIGLGEYLLATGRGNLRLVFRGWREGTFKTSHSGRVELSYFEGRVAIERETVDVEALADE
jgi:hypothetical protein